MWLVRLLHYVIPLVRPPAAPALRASCPVGMGMGMGKTTANNAKRDLGEHVSAPVPSERKGQHGLA